MLSSSSTTPVVKSAKSMFVIELPVPFASNVLLVKVKVSPAIAASCASTYALTDCWLGAFVALSVAMLSSSSKWLDMSETVPVTSPVTSPSMLATSVPVVTEIPPDLSPAVAVVVPTVNVSADSSQPMNALSPVEPLSINIPESLLDADMPEFNSMMLSAIVVLVVSTVVVVPFTVKFPDMITLPENVALVSLITNSVLPSATTVNAPSEPVSDIVALELPCDMELVETFETSASTYALIDCCVASLVAESEAMLSSSRTSS